MANCCWYDLRVVGEEKNVRELYDAMRWEGSYKKSGVGRVFSCYIDDEGTCADGNYFMQMSGDCAWSIISSMRNDNPNNLEALSERLNLSIEAYGSELGLEFMEHFLVKSGNVEIDECVDYYEISVEDGDLSEYEQNLLKKYGIPLENYLDYAEEGYIRVGGMEVSFEI